MCSIDDCVHVRVGCIGYLADSIQMMVVLPDYRKARVESIAACAESTLINYTYNFVVSLVTRCMNIIIDIGTKMFHGSATTEL